MRVVNDRLKSLHRKEISTNWTEKKFGSKNLELTTPSIADLLGKIITDNNTLPTGEILNGKCSVPSRIKIHIQGSNVGVAGFYLLRSL
jgi:hypothetical protein